MIGAFIFFGASIIMILTVPGERIKKFTPLGVIGGLALALGLVGVMQNFLGLWVFHRVDFLSLFRIPIFLSAAWFPLEVIFGHFLGQYKSYLLITVLILTVPLGASFLHYFLIKNEMLSYHHWNLFYTFFLSLAIHLGLAYYLYLTDRLQLPE